jgi:DNA invertase Pin-like site-specific DNA recombinase
MTLVGYARTSTTDQQAGLADQIATLSASGCMRIYSEHASAASTDRRELTSCLADLVPGDILIITKPDRLARSVRDMMDVIEQLRARDINVRILSMGVDTSTPTGKLILTVLAGVAAWEREIMLERQRAGIVAAQAAGKYKGGRPKSLTAEQLAMARIMITESGPAATARAFGVGRSTLYRALTQS